MRNKFEDMQFEETGRRLKLIKDMPHRWLGTVRLLERFLVLWKTLRRHYFQTEETAFPLDDDHKVLIECFSLVKPVADVITIAQAVDYPAAIDAFMALCRLRKSVLEESSPLPIYDPSTERYSASKPNCFRHTVALEPLTVETRRLLRRAFQSRFFNGYNGTERMNTLEMQVFFHPAYRTLRCLDSVMDPSSAAIRRSEVLLDVINLTYQVAQDARDAGFSVGDMESEQAPAQPGNNTYNTSTSTSMEGLLSFTEFEEPEDLNNQCQTLSLMDRVKEEVHKYSNGERVSASELPTRKLLRWWKAMTTRYPNLSFVAQSVLAHPASSAAIERDFGTAGNLLTGSRSCIDSAFVDISLFLNANYSLIPARVKEIDCPNGSWMGLVPTRYTGEEYIPFEGTEEQETFYDSEAESDVDFGLWE